MKENRSSDGDMRQVRGSVLGTHICARSDTVDASTKVLVQLCASVLPLMSGALLTGLERVLKIEPLKKPTLRQFIVDCYGAPQPLSSVLRAHKRRTHPSHDDNYRLIRRLCDVAREAGRTDRASVNKIIVAAQTFGLNEKEVLAAIQQARLTG